MQGGAEAMAVKVRLRIPSWADRALQGRLLRRFIRQEDGSSAVEFGFVAIPFLALVFAILETAMVFLANQTMETAVADASRLIMTGQAKAGNFDKAKFKEEICKRIVALFDCPGGIEVDVQTYQNFASANTSKPLDADGKLKTNFVYQPGCPGEIVVVRAMYLYPVYVSLLGFNLSDMAGNKRLLISTAAFRNEPFSATC
jgi:Flp pilus assembly protein TadG